LPKIVTLDTALTARVLRIANSSYYSFPGKIDSVKAAVGVLGEADLRNLVLATTVVGSMNSLHYQGVNIDEFWLHSLRCGITARLIARAVGGGDAELLFLAGILHDIGVLVMYQQDPELGIRVSLQQEEKHQPRDQAEREILGFDHAEVSALLIRSWKLPDQLIEMTRCHHRYQLARNDPKLTRVLSLANLLVPLSVDEITVDASIRGLCDDLELIESTLLEIFTAGEQQCEEIRSSILA